VTALVRHSNEGGGAGWAPSKSATIVGDHHAFLVTLVSMTWFLWPHRPRNYGKWRRDQVRKSRLFAMKRVTYRVVFIEVWLCH